MMGPPKMLRLAAYRGVVRTEGKGGRSTVSSALIGELLGVEPSQIRRDLGSIGVTGKRGTGYYGPSLVHRINVVLDAEETQEQLDRHLRFAGWIRAGLADG